MIHFQAIDYLILAVYFTFVLGIGWVLRKQIQTGMDFLTSGRKIPAWIAGLAFLSANLGAQEVIEIGLDVLNPIQPACMDPAALKKQFGDKLCFWGSIDQQQTLPFGQPDDVRREVRTRLGTIGQGGGLIIGPTHHVQLDTPMENFWAMVDAIKAQPGTP